MENNRNIFDIKSCEKHLRIDKDIVEKIINCANINIDIDGSKVKLLPSCAGVYILFTYDGYFYIGSSENIQRRVTTHNIVNYEKIKNVKIYVTDEFISLEGFLINAMKEDSKMINTHIPIIYPNIRIIEYNSNIKMLMIYEDYYFDNFDNYRQLRSKYNRTIETMWQTELFVDDDNDINHLVDSINLETDLICPNCNFIMSHLDLYEKFYCNIDCRNIICPNCGIINEDREYISKHGSKSQDVEVEQGYFTIMPVKKTYIKD